MEGLGFRFSWNHVRVLINIMDPFLGIARIACLAAPNI